MTINGGATIGTLKTVEHKFMDQNHHLELHGVPVNVALMTVFESQTGVVTKTSGFGVAIVTTPSPVYLVGIKLVGSGISDFMLFHNRAIFREKGAVMLWTGIYLELLCVNFKYRLFQLLI